MTAVGVIDHHDDLDGVGSLTHTAIDEYFVSGSFVFVSGSPGPIPQAARILKAGSGVSIVDGGPGGFLTISSGNSGTSISWNEIPVGANDGVNMTFVLANSPLSANSVMLFINGVKQRLGIDSDFTLTGSIVNLTPSNTYRSGSNIDATYPY
jgi:hypothetical protein